MLAAVVVFDPESGRQVKSYTAVGHTYQIRYGGGKATTMPGRLPKRATGANKSEPVVKEQQNMPALTRDPPSPPTFMLAQMRKGANENPPPTEAKPPMPPAPPSRKSNGVRQVPDSIKNLTLAESREVYLYLRDLFNVK